MCLKHMPETVRMGGYKKIIVEMMKRNLARSHEEL